jgi:TonB family protein
MNLVILDAEIRFSRRTGHRTLAASAVLHALLLLWLAHFRGGGGNDPGLAEIVLYEQGGAGGGAPEALAPAAPAAPARETVRGDVEKRETEVRFSRAQQPGDEAPQPQSEATIADQMSARLATLQRSASTAASGLAATTTPALFTSKTGGVPGGAGSGGTAPLALRRGGGTGDGDGSGSGSPLLLARGPGGSGAGTGGVAELALAKLPAPEHTPPAAAPAADTGARRVLAGASLAGPIADRPVLASRTPEYPEWAKREAVEAVVTLYFVVLPDGSIKDNILVQKTAGFEDFDTSACSALRAWRFAPLPAGRSGEQWGTITFRFRLRDAR